MKELTIKNSELTDLTVIQDLYEIATTYMKSKGQVYWPKFDEDFIKKEILDKKQWKILIGNNIACIWAIAFEDELIWGTENAPSLYIHRIATSPKFRGQNLVGKIVSWADSFAKANGLKFIRMDTVGHNQALINHYQKLGFEFLGLKKLENTEGLPAHYNDGDVCLFQREIESF